MKRMPFTSGVLLFAAALIWGFAFVAQSEGMDYLGPFTFNGTRYLLGGAVLLPLVILRHRAAGRREITRMRREAGTERDYAADREITRAHRDTAIGGICCGLVLCGASMFQQFGIIYTTVGKAGFITTLYVILVPIMGLFLKKKVAGIIWVGALMAAVGMYLLCVNERFALSGGDGFLFICAFLFSIHIMVIDHFSPKVDGVELSCVQFFTAGVICCAIGFATEAPRPADFLAGWLPLAYTGFLSSGVAYTLQIVGQRDADPAVASLIFSLESVFSVLAGWLLLRERLSGRELLGCGIMFAAVVLVQLPFKWGRLRKAAGGKRRC